MATARLKVKGSVDGLAEGAGFYLDLDEIVLTTPTPDYAKVDLANGDNTFTTPSGATVMVFVPGTGTATQLKLKGAGGDTGIEIHLTRPQVLCLDTDETTVIINADGTCVGCTVVYI